jgi:hypothetical protein
MAGNARLAAGDKAIPIGSRRFEPAAFDVHRMSELGLGVDAAVPHDAPHRRIVGNFPADRYGNGRHAARPLGVARQRLGREPRPQHDAIRHWVAGGDPERERITGRPSEPCPASDERCCRADQHRAAGDAVAQDPHRGIAGTLHVTQPISAASVRLIIGSVAG